MSSEDCSVTIAYNGEIYNFRELRKALISSGRRFESECDTEVLIEAYREWGLSALTRLNGMFAFAIWDDARKQLILARDRLGIKPLYYQFADGVLTFASELRGLRLHRSFHGQVDRFALANFVRHGYVPGPRTIYQGVWKLQPGGLLIWRDGDFHLEKYWNLTSDDASVPVTSIGEASRKLELLLGEAVERRLVADVPLGAFLSGGVDSSTVVALMKERARGPVRTFSIGFENTSYDEAVYARRIACHLKTEHTELYVRTAEAAEVAHDLPVLYDEPFADSSAIPTVLLSRMTREHVKVALSGDGGDELFGGYTHYRKLERLLPLFALPEALRRILSAVAMRSPASSVRNGLIHLANPDRARLAYGLGWGWGEETLERLCGPGVAAPNPVYLEAFWSAPRTETTRRAMVADACVYLPDDILTKVDRASMSVALEARVPMLDHEVVSFAVGLPLSIVWHGGRTKAPLRAVLEKRVPTELIDRPKKGFSIPIRELLSQTLEKWRADYLAPTRLREEGHFSPDAVPRVLAEARERGGIDEEVNLLWRLICFQRWYERQHESAGSHP
jgi:asparagine synthase (glutamine-hydrolysing)